MKRQWDRVYRLCIESGMDHDAATTRTVDLLSEVQDNLAPGYAEDLLADVAAHVSDTRVYLTDFAERLREHWGEALDLYMAIVEVVEGVIRASIARSVDNGTSDDPLFDLLSQLNGQALRVAREVHVLLSHGYPMGALALSRTLYEIAVRTVVLAEYGRESEHEDLAERYLLHGRIANLKDASVYQRDAELLGYTPFDEPVIQRLQDERDALVERYGTDYKQPYGWAVGLPGITSGRRFDELEALARVSHRRGHYQLTSHLIHADAKALGLNSVTRGGASAVLTNATNAALSDPASHALYALNLTFVNFLKVSQPVSLADSFTAQAIEVLVERAEAAFEAAEMRVVDAEERLQTQLAAEGKRMTPFGLVDLGAVDEAP